MMAIVGAEIAAAIAVAVIVCPAAPSVIPRSCASGVSTLAGRNSAVTSPKVPKASEMTAPHAGRDR